MICFIPAARSLRFTIARPSVFSAIVRRLSTLAPKYDWLVDIEMFDEMSNSPVDRPRGSTA